MSLVAVPPEVPTSPSPSVRAACAGRSIVVVCGVRVAVWSCRDHRLCCTQGMSSTHCRWTAADPDWCSLEPGSWTASSTPPGPQQATRARVEASASLREWSSALIDPWRSIEGWRTGTGVVAVVCLLERSDCAWQRRSCWGGVVEAHNNRGWAWGASEA